MRNPRNLRVVEAVTASPPVCDAQYDFVLDSTGLQLIGQGEWNTAKHGRTRRNWRKLHLAVDSGTGEIAAHVQQGKARTGEADRRLAIPSR